MKGKISVRIRNNKNEYDFTLERNITVLSGRSGSGKTTLYRMVRDYSRAGRASGVRAQVTDDHNITVLEGSFWMDDLRKIHDTVVLVDEDSHFLRSEDFAKAIQGTTNYYLLITRNYLYQLPYSVDEIYEIKGRKKKHFERIWTDRDRMYHEPWLSPLPFHPEIIITEDSNAGFEFFDCLCRQSGIICMSAHGKGNILRLVRKNTNRRVAVIADGAAFGAEIEELAEEQKISNGLLALYLPESFEWLVIRSGVAGSYDLSEAEHPENYADPAEYFSWERYFTALLMRISGKEEYKRYKKEKLAPFYLQDTSVKRIADEIKAIEF